MPTEAELIEQSITMTCLPLRFLFNHRQQEVSRVQMKAFSDSAIFFRLGDLVGTVRNPAVGALLTAEEKSCLEDFTRAFDQLPWRPLPTHPHVSELPDDDLTSLRAPGKRLHDVLRKRDKIPFTRRIVRRLQGWPW